MFTSLPYSSHIMPATTARDMATISQMGPMIAERPANLRALRQNPLLGSASPRAYRAGDKATKRVASSWHFLRPHQKDLTSSSFVSESRLGGFCHAPPYELASSRLVFLDRNYPGKSLETIWPGFGQWGAFAHVWS
jgi:hypothetical protein